MEGENVKRKLSCILLAFVMMLATVPLLGLPAFAEDSVNLQTKVEKGNGQVTVTISTVGKLNADGISFDLEFDEAAFELLKPEELCTAPTYNCEYAFGEEPESEGKIYRGSPYYCSWVSLEPVKNDKEEPIVENGRYIMKPYDGGLFKLVFNIKNNIDPGSYSFTPKNTQCVTIEINDETEKPVVTDKDITVNIDEKPIDVELKEEDIPRGVTVSGTVTSWNDTKDTVIRIYSAETETEDIKKDIKSQTPSLGQNVTMEADIIPIEKCFNQKYSVEGITAGEYVLAVYKPKHAVYITDKINITEDISQNIKLYLLGDVNQDGKINSTDALWARQRSAGSRLLGAYQSIVADVNCDGKINSTDALWIRQISAGSRIVY